MDEPVTPGAPEAGSESPVEVVLEEANDVIIQIVSFVATAAVLLVAWSLRVQKRAKQQRQKPKKRETLPGPADKAHVESLVRECSDAADDLVPELLAGLAASPVLVDAAKESCLAARTSKQLRAGLAGCVARWSEIDSMSLPPPAQQSLLLLLHQLYQHKVPERTLRLSDEELQQRDEVAALVGQLLLSGFEAACTQQRLRPALALARLIACNRSGVWSWEEAECLQLCRDARPGLPHPRISVEASVKSWMGAPVLAPGSTVELSLTVHRQHAGPSGAPYERLAMRGHEPVRIMESYTCLLSREVDGSGGAKGSLYARLEVEVEDVLQREATATMKMTAPRAPGDYQMKVSCLSLVVLGVAAEATCRFTVVPADDPRLQQGDSDDQNDDYD